MNLRNTITAKSALLLFLACLLAGAHHAGAQARPVDPELTVHEWGTFTSIAGNDGQAIEWSPLTGVWPSADLPGFIEHFGYLGFKVGLRGTVRMETPVLYFYSPHDLTVSVQVSFAKGLITEWYPHASLLSPIGELSSPYLYEKNDDGTILWNSVHVEPGLTSDFPREATDNNYYAARETSAAPVRVETSKGEQHEKFLFYRGVSAVSVPISAKLTAGNKLLVGNLGQQDIPNVILFERRGEKLGYRISNGLQSEVLLKPPELTADIGSLYSDLEQILVARGLYRDEAHAMVHTWRNSWFEEGSRLFYIVPATLVDTILPLTISPAPARTVRVFVGRLEIVNPATEKAVEAALAAHDEVTLGKYARFLNPILEIMSKKSPAMAQRLSELLCEPCE
ncbi:MAG TPA: hypothetical protein VKY85_27670 [Candidatus Angelobacter sp.]|nr:hypothetical protein [Candidatus Angelobacter sp.]